MPMKVVTTAAIERQQTMSLNKIIAYMTKPSLDISRMLTDKSGI